jgi:V8-like Glu-specific endopeptidase
MIPNLIRHKENVMKKRLFRFAQALIGILLIAVFLFGTAGDRGGAIAASPISVPETVVEDGNISVKTDPSGVGWKAATRPWTTERMQAAKPLDLQVAQGEFNMTLAPEATVAEPTFSPSALPGNAKVAPTGFEELNIVSFASPLGYSYPAPFSRWSLTMPNFTKKFPYQTAGVLFFSDGVFDYRCSASSIGNYAIWTAGHCVHAGNGLFSGWYEDFVFVPAYRDGAAPFGIWIGSNAWTNTSWYNSGDLRFDLGGVVLNTNGLGQKISFVVGNLGFQTGLPVQQAWIDFGWPAESPFGGKYLQICASSYAYSDGNFAAPQPVGIGCDQTGGSSGGPWIKDFSYAAGATNYVNGHNSYRYTTPSHPLEMFSPYFGGAASSLRNSLVTDTP